jgi:hypothetical protein
MARQGDNHYLVMNEATTDDSGIYMANAANSEGEAKSYSRLNVRSGDGTVATTTQSLQQQVVPSSPGGSRHKAPEFKKLFYDQRVAPGDSLRLDTIILGSPKPKVKWLFNDETPQIENLRCIMAGDTYSFIIENFGEQNCGRYAILAENQHGKATCSAEIVFEGAEFSTSNSYEAESETANTKTHIAEESTTKKIGGFDQRTHTKTVSTESRGIETMPLITHDLSTQSMLPEMRDMSSQSHQNTTRGFKPFLQ